MFDSKGRRIAEYYAGTGALIREYVWMGWDPVAVIEGGVISFVRADHIGRPVFATNASGVKVWTASYNPFGGVVTSTGAIPAARFPGQWFQSESGLHQNWMRDYDPTTGRYLQADPLGLVDGASVYGYVGGNPGRWVDPRGLLFDEKLAEKLLKGTKNAGRTVGSASRLGPIGLGLLLGLGIGPTADATMDGGYKQMEEACPDWDCRKASDQEVKRIVESAGEKDAHAYKKVYGAIPNKYWDICICKTGNVVLRRTGKCGMSGVTIPTWEVY